MKSIRASLAGLCLLGLVLLGSSSPAHGASDLLTSLGFELAAASVQNKVPATVDPPATEWGSWAWTTHSFSYSNSVCFAYRYDLTLPLAKCQYGEVGAAKTLVLIGDSQAFQWLPAFDAWGIANHWKVVVLTKAGCHPWPSPDYTYDEHKSDGVATTKYPQCPQFNAWAKAKVLKLKPQAIVVGGGIGTLTSLNAEHAIGIVQGMQRLVGSFATLKAPVIMLGNIPWFIEDAPSPNCLALNLAKATNCAMNRPQMTNPSRPLMAEMSKAISMMVKGKVLPIVPVVNLVCGKYKCPTISNSTVIYYDGTHVSRQWVTHVADALGLLLQPYLPAA
jgi:hypothetical protein